MFDVEDLVTVLEDENAIDIQVIDIKPEFRFVDHMVIVSGRSYRHLNAIADTIHWIVSLLYICGLYVAVPLIYAVVYLVSGASDIR